MVLKIRSLAIVVLLMIMLFSGVVCGEEYSNLLLGGIQQDAPSCVEPCSSATNVNYKEIAASLDAYYFPMYYQGDLIDQIGEVQSAATEEKTDLNGLNNEAVNGKSYDTIIAYSGGTATAMTVLANYEEYHVTCDTLILISPMKAGLTDELYNRIEAKVESCGLDKECLVNAGILSDLDPARRQAEENYRNQVAAILDPMNNPPVIKRIIVVTSTQDELMEIEGEISIVGTSIPYDINFVSNIFQVRNFGEYTEREGSAINPDITVTPISVELPEFENNGWGAHQNLFFEYAKTHLSNIDGGVVEFNPEGNPNAVEKKDSTIDGLGAITFLDQNLDAAIRAAIDKPEGAIYVADLDGLEELRASNINIKDISGLEYCTNLKTLSLNCNQIMDVSPLTGLTNLQMLHLTDNRISDVSPFAGLTNLQTLYLAANQITDVSPFAGLTNLQTLDLSFNQITDVSTFAGLTNLQTLNLFFNQITDVSPLAGLTNLRDLVLNCNQITDVSPLAGLTNLQTLALGDSTDVSPLVELTNLEIIQFVDSRTCVAQVPWSS